MSCKELVRPEALAGLTCGMPRSPRHLPIPPVPAAPPHRGFTLVEVVVALVLLGIAALGVASTATFVAHLAATARTLALATRTHANIVDSLRASPCTALGAGTVSTSAGPVRWSTTGSGATRHVRAVLTPGSVRVHAPLVEEVIVPCD